uniref:Venom S1 protease 17 n=1 Tax=Lethocerus distinctifemur TaxID=280095 RepID=A0A2K8JVS5_9HEMI|nr:venom S1 protease 17 [Lethocerus distinctifemur]
MVGYGELHPKYPKVKDVAISCGATIITNHHVLTAAHCTFGDHELNAGIVVGEHDESRSRSKYTRVYPVSRMIEHEGWTLKTFKNDIALLFIKEEIEFNMAVGPACLPTQRPNIVGDHVLITGWGEVQNRADNPDVLRKVHLRVIKLDYCGEAYPHQKIDLKKPTQLCTYSYKRDSCQGDSGGPVAWLDPDTNRYTLVGVVSFSKACAGQDPGVNTDVFSYLGWIQENIKKTTPAKTCSKV